MKIRLVSLLFSWLLLVGCENNLEEKPLDFFEESNSFNTDKDATSAINGVYNALRTNSYYGLGITTLSDASGEECFIRADGGSAENIEIDKCRYTSANSNFDNFYTAVYQLINRANRVIDKVPGIAMDAKLRDQIVGEAKFLRALAYFDLVRAFGDVPLITTVSNDVVNVKVPRDPVDKIYQQITQDLLDAEKVVPVKYTAASEIGRATSGAVKSILAKVYLTRKDWTNAAAKAKEVIDSRAYALFPDYKSVFLPENKNGIEHIFSVQYSCVQQTYGSAFAKIFAIYFTYPIDLEGGAYQATDAHEASYLPGDYRKQVTIIREKKLANGTVVQSRTGAFNDKYWDPTPCGPNQARNNFMVIRYADVLLMYAEALNELNGPTADAFAAINQVRARARNGVATAAPQDLTGLTKEQFRDAVLQERSWELCFEGHRRWDLLRTGKYLDVIRKSGIPAEDKHLLYPIPQNEIDVNPALVQNPGY
ncbi:RagB/SusD family nutrient uptake outer membrane protein [Larkinella knui]|uniref:RagB/SusD family nutrient uptake outer membrane protein n=1 Tax=Larkinella knui TaxID=2025310 RepID=A0A3P1CHK9_9BACT|nr:RagB/SusD family nutrient uptake outer membrane protein [Larkinella knui]RRB12757.1 RagB/SusD family nutrient uptake outer membrane protein [Larkinella knui]